MSGRWLVKAFENFGAPGEGEVFDLGTCDMEEQAVAYAKHHVRKSLEEYAQVSLSVNDLIRQFEAFGEEAVVFSPDGVDRCAFSARGYARSIAREVFQDRHRTEVHPVLRAAYSNTDYVAALREGDVVIRIGQSAPTVDAWLKGLGKHSALFLSAWNPMSAPLTVEENTKRHAALIDKARASGWPFVEAVGRSPDGAWSETSLLISGLNDDEAQQLARQFEQAGFVWIDRGKPASLRIRTTRDIWVEESDLA